MSADSGPFKRVVYCFKSNVKSSCEHRNIRSHKRRGVSAL